MRAITREELKASTRPTRSPSLTRTSSATPDTCPWVLSPAHNTAAHANANARFVAGTAFFNYSDYGSLRPGQEPIALASKAYIGFAVHAFVCGFAFNFFSYGHGTLLAQYLHANDERQVKAANSVLVWPSTLSIVIGFVSDSVSICGYRRKGYMILGWMLTLAMCGALIVLDEFSHSGRLLYAPINGGEDDDDSSPQSSPYVLAYLLVSLLAAIGIQISWVSAIAASIEYAQREHIHHRGRHHGALLTLFNAGAACAMLLVWRVISVGRDNDHLVSTLSIGEAAMILAGVSLAVIPIVVFGYQEARVDVVGPPPAPPPIAMGQRLHTFWRFCHQNVVYRVLLFVIFHLFLIAFSNQNVRDAVETWSGVDEKDALAVEFARNVIMALTVLCWTIFLRNVHWRKIVVWASIVFIASYVVLTTLTTYDVVRNPYFYGAMYLILDVPRALLLLFCVHFAGEIADVGYEGATVGLALSYQRLAALAGFVIAAMVPSIPGFRFSSDDVVVDSPDTRARVIKAFFVTVAIKLLSFLVIKLLPQQKLDAQQLRAFGGYNKYAGVALLITLVLLVGFNLAVNLVTML